MSVDEDDSSNDENLSYWEVVIKYLPPTDEADNGAACTNCMKPSKTLVTCGGCKRVKYCNKKCQEQNWKKHKPVCKILRAYSSAAACMPDQVNEYPCRMTVPNKFATFKNIMELTSRDNDELSKLGPIATQVVEIANFSDESWRLAKNVVMKTPFCPICLKNQYRERKGEFDVDEDYAPVSKRKWKCCPVCNYGWCCKKHFKEYEPMHTKEICQEYVRLTSVQRFQYNHTINYGKRFLFMPEKALSKPVKRFFKNWQEYFRLRSMKECNMGLPDAFFPAATYLLSQPLTCLYGMYQHDQSYFTTAEELIIHVVGSGAAFECENGGQTCVWEEIMHCLPSVRTMKISFIGPDCGIWLPEAMGDTCPDCCAKGRSRYQAFYNTTYHDHFASSDFSKPDFIVALNTRMNDECTESWKESLEIMLDLDVPCIFTSSDENEGKADLDVLREVKARTLTDTFMRNPFSADFSNIDFSSFDKFFRWNWYYICLRGRQM